MRIKETLLFLVLVSCLILPYQNVFAQSVSAVNIYFFWGDGCPHCAKEEPFLKNLESKYPEIKVQYFETWHNNENRKLLIEAGKALRADISGVPFTVIGDRYISGYYNDAVTGREIEAMAQSCIRQACPDPVGAVLRSIESRNEPAIAAADKPAEQSTPSKITVPILGEIDAKNLSLPLITIVLGALDGFNPCAMWTLLFLISLLLGMQDRKKMWILGGAFIAASASVYFVFMAAWLNLILFIGIVIWVRIIIGLVAIAGGGYNLKEYFTNRDGVCKVTSGEKEKKVFGKLEKIIQQKSFYLALGGIIVLAAAVNLVELICSAGLPTVYTQILALSNLAKWQYYLYILFYIFVFMLDDLLVFFVAMSTLRIAGITTKYSRWSHLIGGILMLAIGLLLIFKPELLMFG